MCATFQRIHGSLLRAHASKLSCSKSAFLLRAGSNLRRGAPLATWENSRSQKTSAKMDDSKSNQPEKRCAIITGVASPFGIGRTLVQHFINEGYRVVGADVKRMEDAEPFAGKVLRSLSDMSTESFHFVQADISDPLQAKRIVELGIQWFGDRIHVLINNAAISNPEIAREDSMKAFSETIAVNLNGAYYMSECVLPYMPAGQSSIIHISSTRALQSEPHTEAYSASKAGLCGLTHSQAITLAGKVRVNVVLPGWINTDGAGEAALRPVDHVWHPVGRVGEPSDVAHLCLFLCDNERSGFITGQEFVVDGGVTKKMIYPE